MDEIKRYLVVSIGEFVQCIKQIKEKEKTLLWYRGHSKASYKLLPGILREPFVFHNHKGEPFIPNKGEIVFLNNGGYKGFNTERLLESFKKEYIKKKNRIYIPKDDFEWLCLMQHYDMPTRLLDWSTNAFTALYFALTGAPPKGRKNHIKKVDIPDIYSEREFDGAVVYVITPKKINSENIFSPKPYRAILNLSKKELIDEAVFPLKTEKSFFVYPICVSSKKFDFRILAQQGTFMLFGKANWDFEYIDQMKKYISKIFIPTSALTEMSSDLRNLGFDTKTFFPDLDRNAVIAKNRLNKSVKRITSNEESYVQSILNIY